MLRTRANEIARGDNMQAAYAALATGGDAALDAALEAMRAGCPKGRHRNDWDADLTGIFIRVAEVDPWPLVARIRAASVGNISMLWALGHCRHRDMTRIFTELLDDERAIVREKAAIALGHRRVKRALAPLLELLGGRYLNFDVLQAVARFDDPAIIEPLEALVARGKLPFGSERIARSAIERAQRKA